MDRKKIIVTTVMINAGILTALFIAAMTMREEQGKSVSEMRETLSVQNPEPLYKEMAEIPAASIANSQSLPSNGPASFVLPPVEEQRLLPAVAVEMPAGPIVLASPPVAPVTPLAISPSAPVVAPPASSSAFEIEVQRGDSLEKLAKTYRTSVDEIIKFNQLPSSFLRAGQRLKIPAEKMAEAPKIKNSSASQVADQAEYYTMKVGDNPWSIAMKHHMKVNELLKLNGLNEKTARKLKPGDRLRIK